MIIEIGKKLKLRSEVNYTYEGVTYEIKPGMELEINEFGNVLGLPMVYAFVDTNEKRMRVSIPLYKFEGYEPDVEYTVKCGEDELKI